MTEQVLTRAECLLGEKGYTDQEPIAIQEAVGSVLGHLYDRQTRTHDDKPPAPPPTQRASGAGAIGRLKRPKRQRKSPRRGGWPPTKYISRERCRETRAGAGLLAL